MLDLLSLLERVGYLGLFVIIFAESGFLLGWFFPGDSLLFTAGFLSSIGYLHIVPVILLSFFGAVFGDSFGYFTGNKLGHRIFTRENSLFFDKRHIERAEAFYKKHGPKAIILARFIPVIRTFAPIMAGVGTMHYSTFLTYNVIGALIWGIGIPLAGFFLGNSVPGVDRYILPILFGIVIVSMLPTIIQILRDKGNRDRIRSFFKRS